MHHPISKSKNYPLEAWAARLLSTHDIADQLPTGGRPRQNLPYGAPALGSGPVVEP